MTNPFEAGEVFIKITATIDTFTPIYHYAVLSTVALTISLPNQVIYTTQAVPTVMNFSQIITFSSGSDTHPFP